MPEKKLNKKYRIFWKADKKLLENYRTPYPLNTETTINSNFWFYYECSTVKELDAKIKEEGLEIQQNPEVI